MSGRHEVTLTGIFPDGEVGIYCFEAGKWLAVAVDKPCPDNRCPMLMTYHFVAPNGNMMWNPIAHNYDLLSRENSRLRGILDEAIGVLEQASEGDLDAINSAGYQVLEICLKSREEPTVRGVRPLNCILHYQFTSNSGRDWRFFDPSYEIIIPKVGHILAMMWDAPDPDASNQWAGTLSVMRLPGPDFDVRVETNSSKVKWSYLLRALDDTFVVVGDLSLWRAEELPPVYTHRSRQ